MTGYFFLARLFVFSDGKIIEYIHDHFGRRIVKKVDGDITEKYLWQGLTRLLAVYGGSDSLLMRFEYADGRMPVSMTRGGSIYYLTYDQVRSLRVVADDSGNVIKRIDYDSFGNIINDSDPTFEIPFGFAGGLHDRDTGLVRFGYRDYDPDIGRWTAKDPIGFWGRDIDLYGYCLNDPRDGGFHRGLDIAAPFGTPVVAIEGGRVIGTGFRPKEGNFITYETRSGLQVQVYHLSAINVKEDDWIYEGQKIGEVGATGCVTGPHLHIQIKPPGGTWVNPWPILIDGGNWYIG